MSEQARPRVALLFGSFLSGGITRMMLRSAAGFIERGVEVDLVVGRIMGDFLDQVPAGARVIGLERAGKVRALAAIGAADAKALGHLAGTIVRRRGPPGKLRYTRDLARYMRDAKLCEIGEGSSQIQRMIIARHLLEL